MYVLNFWILLYLYILTSVLENWNIYYVPVPWCLDSLVPCPSPQSTAPWSTVHTYLLENLWWFNFLIIIFLVMDQKEQLLPILFSDTLECITKISTQFRDLSKCSLAYVFKFVTSPCNLGNYVDGQPRPPWPGVTKLHITLVMHFHYYLVWWYFTSGNDMKNHGFPNTYNVLFQSINA